MDGSAFMQDGLDPSKISPAKSRKGGSPGMFGSERDAEAENAAIYQNLELDILRLT